MRENRSDRPARGDRRRPRRWLAAFVMATIVAGQTPALADDYDPTDAAHPLRVAAYVLHPIGVILDYLIIRPAHWLVSSEPLKTLFGHED